MRKPTREQLDRVRERLLYLHNEYRHYMNQDERALPSTGMVPAYAEVTSGRTNRTSDFTAMHAVNLANLTPERLDALKWIDCAWRVFMRGTAPILNERTDCELDQRRRLATVSYVLYYKAFLGYTFTRLSELPMPNGGRVSRQRVHQFWSMAVCDVAIEAMRDGLI